MAWLLVADNEVAVVIAWLNSDEIGRFNLYSPWLQICCCTHFIVCFCSAWWLALFASRQNLRSGVALSRGAIVGIGAAGASGQDVGWPRPAWQRITGTVHGRGWTWTLDASFHSMPSGHTADLFTGAVMLALAPKLWMRLCLLGVASVGGASRIVVGAHWPSDVLVGAVIGGLAAFCVLRLFPLRS